MVFRKEKFPQLQAIETERLSFFFMCVSILLFVSVFASIGMIGSFQPTTGFFQNIFNFHLATVRQ